MADHCPGKRAPSERKPPSANEIDTRVLCTSFERDCNHLSSLGPSLEQLPLHCRPNSQNGEANRSALPPLTEYSVGALLTTPPPSQHAIPVASCHRCNTAGKRLGTVGIPVVYFFHHLMYMHLSSIPNTPPRRRRRYRKPGGRTGPGPPGRYEDAAFNGEVPSFTVPL